MMEKWQKALLLFLLWQIIDFVMATDECPVCLERENLTMTKCGHSICETCFNDLLEKQYSCPECRGSLTEFSPLIKKSKQNQLEGAKFILKQRPISVNEENEFQETPLTDAIKCENIQFVNLLIEYEADLNLPNGKGEIPYMIARENDQQLIKFSLFEHGANIAEDLMSELFFEAVEVGNVKILALLIQKGQDVLQKKNGLSALMMAARKGDVSMTNFFFDITENKQEILEQVSEEGNTVLMYAVECDENLSVFELLLEKGANVNQKNKKGRTVFIHAASAGSVKIVKFFIKKYPEIIEQVDIFQNTALMCACFGGQLNVVKFLLENGANVRHQNEKGETALMLAAEKGEVKIADLLIKKDATTILQISHAGGFPLDFAISNDKLSVVKYFFEDNRHFLTEEMIEYARKRIKKCSTKMKKFIKNIPTPVSIMTAVKYGDIEKLKTALKREPDTIDVTNENFETPLMIATKNEHELIIKLLIDHNADIYCISKHGDTAHKIARRSKNTRIILMLIKANRTKRIWIWHFLFMIFCMLTKSFVKNDILWLLFSIMFYFAAWASKNYVDSRFEMEFGQEKQI